MLFIVGFSSSALSQDVYVKYRGTVNVSNGHFAHLVLKPSSFIKNMFYDKRNNYLLVQLKSTYYHYCAISESVINDWKNSPSLGKYYNYNIKGNHDCRVYSAPKYYD